MEIYGFNYLLHKLWNNTFGPLYLWVTHPQIQSTADGKYLEKNYVVAYIYYVVRACDVYVCTEHKQTFSLSLFPKQYSITNIYTAYVVLNIISNIEMN